MTGGQFDEYLSDYLARHQRWVTRVLTVGGDFLYVGGPVLGALTRKWRVVAIGLAAGAVVTAAAHLFERGTLADELAATLRHPLWAARAEAHRLFPLSRPG